MLLSINILVGAAGGAGRSRLVHAPSLLVSVVGGGKVLELIRWLSLYWLRLLSSLSSEKTAEESFKRSWGVGRGSGAGTRGLNITVGGG